MVHDTSSDQLLNATEAGRIFGKSPETIARWVRSGTIPHVSVPGSKGYRFRRDTLLELVKQFETVAPTVAEMIGSAR